MIEFENDDEIDLSAKIPFRIPLLDDSYYYQGYGKEKIDDEHNSSKNDTLSLTLVGVVVKEATRKHAVYKINVVAIDGKKWSVYRRYSDFVALNQKLKEWYPNLVLKLPPKRYFFDNFDQNFMIKRQHGLERFISNIVALKHVYDAKPVQHFFRIDNHPNINRDLKLYKEYSTSARRLEHTTNELRQIVKWQTLQISQLKQELQDLSERANESSSGDSKVVNKLILEKQHVENQLLLMTSAFNKKEIDIRNLKEEYARREIYASKTRKNDRSRQEQEMNEQKTVFNEKQRELSEAFEDISKEFAEYGKVKTLAVNQQDIDLKSMEDVGAKSNRLRHLIKNYQSELDKLYSLHVSLHQKEIEELVVENANCNELIMTKVKDIKALNIQLQEYRKINLREISKRDDRLTRLEEDLRVANESVIELEQKYFFALYIGVRLNDVLYTSASDDLLPNEFDPGDLYLAVKEDAVAIGDWPRWLSAKLRFSFSETLAAEPGFDTILDADADTK